jgi:prephenate dehydrogenase
MESVAIIGVGLIGGSFGLARRAAGFSGRVVGVSSRASIETAVAMGAVDKGVSLDDAARTCDLLYLAQPISVIEETLQRIGDIAPADTLVTDVGSTKVSIVETAGRVIRRARFIGGHPMAGKESRGVAAGSADLFRGRPYILTPTSAADLHTPAGRGFQTWIERCGANIVTVTPEEHDRAVAFVSHLPQMASTALAACLADSPDASENVRLAGPGLTDMSRLALSSVDIWRDIVRTNTANIDHALSVYIDKLTELRDNLQTQNLGDVFGSASVIAQRIRRQN